ncbi:hypothetical protein ACFVMC_00905 [Nocardia sp. NPDC127579]|uniref:hypothetical protein n=1 Tax=Nocardia sp. NPDC127579 TaxID=3345402 RepID=UPI003624D5E8
MDPVTAVVASAIAAGAVTGLGDTPSQAVLDAYSGLRRLISDKYQGVDLTAVERKPDSQSKRESLAEDLQDAGAAGDAELAQAAVAVLEAVRRHAAGAVVGVDLSDLVAAALDVVDVKSAGDGVRVVGGTIAGAVRIHGVEAGFQAPPDPYSARP